jgi:hypothetical protein
LILSIPDEGYSRFSNLLILSIPDEHYSRFSNFFLSILSIIRKLYKFGAILYLIITPKDEQMNYPFLFVPSYSNAKKTGV